MVTYIETCGATIKYDTDLNIHDYLVKNKDNIEFTNLNIDSINKSDYIVRYKNSNMKEVFCDSNSISIYYPIDQINEETIIYPATTLIEKQYHDMQIATCHSACVCKDNSGILLLGKTGSGKTTTALNLCINYDYFLMSNDKTLLKYDNNNVYAVGGPKFIFLRYESIKRNIPRLLTIFDGKHVDKNYCVNSKFESIDTWSKKIRIQPEDLNIKPIYNQVKINHVYVLHVDERQHNLIIKSGNTLANRLLLTENLNKLITSTETKVNDKNYNLIGYIPSYDSKEYFEFKKEMINVIFNDLSIQYISGNIENVSEYINKVNIKK